MNADIHKWFSYRKKTPVLPIMILLLTWHFADRFVYYLPPNADLFSLNILRLRYAGINSIIISQHTKLVLICTGVELQRREIWAFRSEVSNTSLEKVNTNTNTSRGPGSILNTNRKTANWCDIYCKQNIVSRCQYFPSSYF